MKIIVDYEAARELNLFASNDEDTYMRSLTPTMDNMDSKKRRGLFDSDKARKAFEHVAEYAARNYCKAFGGNWCQVFNAATRRATADLMLDAYMSDLI